MKKLLCFVTTLLLLFVPTKVLAAGYINPSPSSLSVQQGSSTTFKITAYNAIGDVTISSSNSSIATVSASSWSTGMVGDGETKVGTITVTGVGVGSTQIILNIDGASFDGESVSGTKSINVTVNAKPAPAPSPSPSPSTPKPSQPSTPSQPVTRPSTPVDNRSNNSNLSKLTIDKKEISKTDGVYLLEVSNYKTSVDIGAVCEHNKATVSGTGKRDLVVGDNNFDIVVTAENGATSVYKVVIKKNEFNLLKDIDELLKLKESSEIKLLDNDKLDEDTLNKIIDSKKKIVLNKYDDKDIKLYSWVLDGSLIKSVDEFNPVFSDLIDNNEKMEEDLNYADGIYLDLRKCGGIPKGIVLKYNVSYKYKDKDSINLYSYNDKNGNIKQLSTSIVSGGFVDIEISDSFKHFLSKTKLSKELIDNGGNIGWMISSIILFIIVVVLVIIIVIIRKKDNVGNSKLKDINVINNTTTDTTNITDTSSENVNEEII